MAYVSQELKARIAPRIKEILSKHGLKGTMGVRHHSTLVLKVSSGPIDFIGNYNEVSAQRPEGRQATNSLDINRYWYQEHFTGRAKECLGELLEALNDGNHDRSDIQSDYFDVGFYVDLKIGTWDKPYQLIK